MSLMDREALVLNYIRRNPFVLEPEEALAAVVWPSEGLLKRLQPDPDTESKCRGCGVPHSQFSEDCRLCYQRDYARRKAQKAMRERAYRPCAGCGVGWDERTYGCKVCSNRFGKRRRRREAA